jgi:hypothetical protein
LYPGPASQTHTRVPKVAWKSSIFRESNISMQLRKSQFFYMEITLSYAFYSMDPWEYYQGFKYLYFKYLEICLLFMKTFPLIHGTSGKAPLVSVFLCGKV